MKKTINAIIGIAINDIDVVWSHLLNISTDSLTRDEHQSLTDAMASLKDAIDILNSMRD